MRFLSPIFLHYYITERCNCSCTFCAIWKIQSSKTDDAILDDVLANLRDAKKLGVRFVDFTGGEPLLHDDVPDMLAEAKRLGLKTTVTTNCLRYTKRASALAGLVDFLHFSLDGLSPEKHDCIRGQRTFSAVMQSLDHARHVGETPDLLFTVNRDNLNHLEPMVEFAQKLGFMLIVNPVFAYSSFESSDMHVLKQVDRFAATPYVYVNKAFHLLRRRGGNNIQSPRCRVMDSTIVISADNKVVLPCYHFQREKMAVQHKVMASDSRFFTELRGHLHRKMYSWNTRSLRHFVPRSGLVHIRKSSTWRYYQKNQGRFDFCRGCHVNCYFDPSFHYKMDEYFTLSTLAKSRYWWDKTIRRQLRTQNDDTRPAAEIAADIMEKYGRT